MHDVAARAGVSIKTVSNVLNDYHYLRESTKARVYEAIDELGYQRNVAARNLRQGRTGRIGLAVPELSLSYFGELADLIIHEAAEIGLEVLIEPTAGDREREIGVLANALDKSRDGLLFSPVGLRPEDGRLLRVDYPLVVLGEGVFVEDVDHVTMRNADAARAATDLLLDRGCRRIAAIGAHPGETASSASLRLDGYAAALRNRGVGYDDRLVGPADDWHRRNGAEAMRAVLDSGARPDGVFAFNDTLALGAMHFLQLQGVRVPQDVQIVGFDDVDDAQYSFPGLTTVSPGRAEIARTAVRLLDARIRGTGPEERQLHLAEFTVVERGSTRPAPSAEA